MHDCKAHSVYKSRHPSKKFADFIPGVCNVWKWNTMIQRDPILTPTGHRHWPEQGVQPTRNIFASMRSLTKSFHDMWHLFLYIASFKGFHVVSPGNRSLEAATGSAANLERFEVRVMPYNIIHNSDRTRYFPSRGQMSDQRRRRWSGIGPRLGRWFNTFRLAKQINFLSVTKMSVNRLFHGKDNVCTRTLRTAWSIVWDWCGVILSQGTYECRYLVCICEAAGGVWITFPQIFDPLGTDACPI